MRQNNILIGVLNSPRMNLNELKHVPCFPLIGWERCRDIEFQNDEFKSDKKHLSPPPLEDNSSAPASAPHRTMFKYFLASKYFCFTIVFRLGCGGWAGDGNGCETFVIYLVLPVQGSWLTTSGEVVVVAQSCAEQGGWEEGVRVDAVVSLAVITHTNIGPRQSKGWNGKL